jgi:pimeloyl-ACP methyl ester carboxylesterase
VREWGERGRRPLLFWHALGAVLSGAWIGEAAEELAARGLHVVALDGPGFGASPALPPARYAVDALAELLWRIADELELERPALAGHSWGGTVAVHAAADRPSDVSALVLLDSGHLDYADDPSSNPEATLEERIERARGQILAIPSFDALIEEVRGEIPRDVTPALVEALRAGVRETADGVEPIVTPETRGAAMQGAVDERPSRSWPVLADAAVPVLLLLATEPAEARERNEAGERVFREVLPHAEVRWCEGWGHDVLADGGPVVGTIVADWLDRIP